jgi:hypothetical protein
MGVGVFRARPYRRCFEAACLEQVCLSLPIRLHTAVATVRSIATQGDDLLGAVAAHSHPHLQTCEYSMLGAQYELTESPDSSIIADTYTYSYAIVSDGLFPFRRMLT